MKHLYTVKHNWLNQAVAALQAGQLIIYPTETSYGLGADATNPVAIDKLLAYKGNRLNKAISVAISSKSMANEYISFNPTAANVFDTLLPGPVTLIATSTGKVALKVESERHTLGIRYSSLPLVNQLVAAFGKPITATSANTSGTKSIYSFSDFQKYVSPSRQTMIDLFLDAGDLPIHPPSTIVDTTLNNPQILRQGQIVFSDLDLSFISSSPQETITFAAGLISQHLDLLQSKPIILALEGELGAGKTHFAKGIAQALGINQTVNSPTYTIMKEYPYHTAKVAGTFYHLDTWRLHQTETLDDFQLQSKLLPGNLFIIEWQQKANSWLSQQSHPAIAYIKLDVINHTTRQIRVKWS
jgi:L-threonylcarbamoyladenylate synthase